MTGLVLTAHQRREAARTAAQASDRPESAWALLGRPLVHAIRYALDVALPRDVAWLEACRDRDGEALLAELRGRTREFTPADWADLRRGKPAVWRMLRHWVVGHAPLSYRAPEEVLPCAS